jgi:murein DD-endopeptidase MepM/ murein hydrolase activator NlpD
MHAPQRDLASVEVWDRSLERSRRRRVLAAQGRREVARRKQASAAAAAAMVVSPTAAAFAAAGSGGAGGASGVATASAANRAIAPGAPAGLLRLGDTGPDVIRVQTALGQTPDGVFGPRTDRAVRVFQGRNGLLVDGIVGPHTWGTLFGPHGASYDPVAPRYQFKIQRASAVEEARVRPALAGKGPVAKIVLKTTPAADQGTTAPAPRSGHRHANTVPAVDRSSPAPAPHRSSPPRSSAPVSTSCGSSRIVAPVRGYTVTGDFGEQRPGHLHTGLDLAVAYGTPIVAAACGVVTTAGVQGGYGNIVCVKHSSTLTTCYAHMSRFATRVGQTVHQGQVIGYVGCTGSCTGPHVHFETRVNGSPVDPAPYLSGSRRARVTTVHASSSKPSTRSSRVRTASSGGKPSSSATRLRSAGGSGGASSASGPGGDSSQSSAQTAQPAVAPEPAPAPAPAPEPAPAPAPAQQTAPAPAPAPAQQAAPAPAPAPQPAPPAPAPAPEPQAAPDPAPTAQAAPDPAPAPAQQAPAEPAPAPQQAAPEPVKPEPPAQAAPAAEEAPAAEAPSAPAEPAPAAEAPSAPTAAAPEAPAASPTE